ncbi:ATP-dependent Clp protease adaptor protein ClpS [Roseivirga pacifica]|uniref:ATP-dependent Clp protease adaptor protein ClpS n=1 Tax=Roseivirga pacifica TaxID=1267423 RepID=A0A1I0NEP9_9BACT|nr:ATP-dependent Clp protease adaptor ClpS [Roseivirga pacifica]MCO6359646.1 ATP-dependent Clp protease adaptor ClpS [Roseivirga pacifica]MCO6367016.1 ATP-dependent Clp protease adaptor ClpS [Roseivirga pacifica]MCO6370452.1 ATP-dependent Clp protease adaptor ClpS [Roseivirga pacifica]MCO6374673.1 ATP-dependent Clp protease adaptor ClpS [Roseivirga pacifica]MCO6379931.1 ATP-dependent Clp protease adaptor ClpS [Roseivirga pacifica]
MRLSYQEQESVEVLEEVVEDDLCDLVVFNDDVNTFEHVINTLVKVCNHSVEQAEQCTLLIHYKGKCTVKHGSFTELRPMCESILSVGITATVL